MALTHLPLEQINESHLQALMTADTAESLYIEYKRQTYGGNDDSRAEFLADISSFANAHGGDVIIGIEESEGRPQAFLPFTGNADEELRRLQQMARDGIQPRISNLQTLAVSLAQGGHVLLIRIPRSYNSPHRVSFKNKNRFWARSSGGKYEPNIDELRGLFNAAPQIAGNIRDFRFDRVSKIAAGLAPVNLTNKVVLIIHVIPFSAFSIGQVLDISNLAQQPNQFPPPARGYASNWHVNFDGLLTVSHSDANASSQPAYTQVFRTGIVEAVTSIQHSSGDISAIDVEANIVKWSSKYMASLAANGVEPPMVVLASLSGVKDVPMITGTGNALFPPPPVIIKPEQLHFMETIFEAIPASNNQCARTLRPMLEQLANAAGLPASVTFNESGDWRYT